MDLTRRELLLAAGAPLLLAAARPVLALAGAAGPLALVTADSRSHVVAVDILTGRVRGRVQTPAGPRSIERAGAGIAVVAHTEDGAVSIVDGRRLRVLRVLRGMAEPRYTAARPRDRLAYVTDSGRGELVALDLARGRIVGRLDLGGPARHVGISPDGRRLWTSLGSRAAEIALVDLDEPTRPRLVRRIRPPFRAHDVAVAPDGRRVWVTSGDRGRIAVYDAADVEPVLALDADAPPQHVAFGPGVVYVTSGDDGRLRVHDQRDGRLLRTASVPTGSYNIAAGWGWAVTPSLSVGTLCIMDRAGRPVERLAVAPAAHDACLLGPAA
jgi:DNA-binding beta-propeller fold protein YncE